MWPGGDAGPQRCGGQQCQQRLSAQVHQRRLPRAPRSSARSDARHRRARVPPRPPREAVAEESGLAERGEARRCSRRPVPARTARPPSESQLRAEDGQADRAARGASERHAERAKPSGRRGDRDGPTCRSEGCVDRAREHDGRRYPGPSARSAATPSIRMTRPSRTCRNSRRATHVCRSAPPKVHALSCPPLRARSRARSGSARGVS